MLSKKEQKQIRLLGQKKYRYRSGLFIAEGMKIIRELVQEGFKSHKIYSTTAIDFAPYNLVDQEYLNVVSHLTSGTNILAVFKIPKVSLDSINMNLFSLALDSVSDPGNLGSIIRSCDWYGIKNLFCSPDTVDCFNPKVVQSSMGSIARVNCHYIDLNNLIDQFSNTVYGSTLNGINHYEVSFDQKGLLIMGSESHGISRKILEKIDKRITIKSIDPLSKVNSLNVSSATAILLGEIFRP